MTWRSWGAAGKDGERSARRTVFEYGQATNAMAAAASGVRRPEAGSAGREEDRPGASGDFEEHAAANVRRERRAADAGDAEADAVHLFV
jgi:hypothetical protein